MSAPLQSSLSDSGVLTLTFNRPEKKNAFNQALYEGLVAALDDARQIERAAHRDRSRQLHGEPCHVPVDLGSRLVVDLFHGPGEQGRHRTAVAGSRIPGSASQLGGDPTALTGRFEQ